MQPEYKIVLFGFIFDLSLKHLNGARIIDIVKKETSDFINKNIVSDDKIYFYSILDRIPKNGVCRSAISQYEPAAPINYWQAIKHVNSVFDKEDLDAVRCIALITDKFDTNQQFGLNKGFNKSSSYIGVFSQPGTIAEDPHSFYPLDCNKLNLNLTEFLDKVKNDY